MVFVSALLIVLPPALALLWVRRRTGLPRHALFHLLATVSAGAAAMAIALVVGMVVSPLVDRLSGVWRDLSSAFVVTGFVEEASKLIVIVTLLALRNRPGARPPGEGHPAWIGAIVGIGFAFVESLLYVGRSPAVLLLRGVTALPLHMGTGVVLGYSIRPDSPRSANVVGFLSAVALHGVYDLLVSADGLAAYAVAPLIAGILIGIGRLTARASEDAPSA